VSFKHGDRVHNVPHGWHGAVIGHSYTIDTRHLAADLNIRRTISDEENEVIEEVYSVRRDGTGEVINCGDTFLAPEVVFWEVE
jgi:hypothetical protein